MTARKRWCRAPSLSPPLSSVSAPLPLSPSHPSPPSPSPRLSRCLQTHGRKRLSSLHRVFSPNTTQLVQKKKKNLREQPLQFGVRSFVSATSCTFRQTRAHRPDSVTVAVATHMRTLTHRCRDSRSAHTHKKKKKQQLPLFGTEQLQHRRLAPSGSDLPRSPSPPLYGVGRLIYPAPLTAQQLSCQKEGGKKIKKSNRLRAVKR